MTDNDRVTDPTAIRAWFEQDWSDHYETTTPRGATPMFDADQDLSEREADANALEAYRAMVAKLEDRVERLNAAIDRAHLGRAEAEDAETAMEMRLDRAEARVDQLTDQLRDRSEALNRTGESNDTLRAQVERVHGLARSWEATRKDWEAGVNVPPASYVHMAAHLRAALGES